MGNDGSKNESGRKHQGFYQGIFEPTHPEKYKGKSVIYFRSSWELKFMRFMDLNSSILEWSSESLSITYLNPITGRPSRYYPDFLIKYIDKTGEYHFELIEIKPFRETKIPSNHGNKKKTTLLREAKTWKINEAKWEAARKFCDSRGIDFRIITENELNKF